MLRTFRADLHIHTCLSPCADIDMSPSAILETAEQKGLDIIAICDHNSAENVAAAVRAASDRELTVLCGMEIASQEEAHIIALFDTPAEILELQRTVYAHLPKGMAVEMNVDDQIVVNEFDEVEGFNTKLLIGATDLSVHDIVDIVHNIGGLAIASHIDREMFSIVGQLGFIPEDLPLDAVEISANTPLEEARESFAMHGNFPMITSSDAHFLNDIGKVNTDFFMAEPTTEEMKKAFLNVDGSSVIYSEPV
ncbi:MAG: PHP domain-containing protein [Gemmatimonadota bacterium]|nr:MAG: PHP domain-containing protein [Gemmatimonadota bacterium]